jgi:hypothetical protein
MRLNLPAYFIALALISPMLAGCLEKGQPTLVNADGDDDDAFCQRNNVKQGSSEYIACRKDRDVQRNNANARADKRRHDEPSEHSQQQLAMTPTLSRCRSGRSAPELPAAC